jgi:hypothetical protein
MPDNVRSSGYISYVKKHEAVLFSDDAVQKIVEAINTGKMAKGILKSFETRATHIEFLKDRHSSTTIFPKCASSLVLRTVKSGQKGGYRSRGYPERAFRKTSMLFQSFGSNCSFISRANRSRTEWPSIALPNRVRNQKGTDSVARNANTDRIPAL